MQRNSTNIINCLAILLLSASLWSCSSAGTKVAFKPQVSVKAEDQAQFDSSSPASFEDYKEWRKINDPDGQLYADYKAWKIAHQQWLKSQATKASQLKPKE